MNLPNFYSVLIPKVRYSREITWFDKVLFSEIVALTNVKGYCYAHNSYFENVFDVSVSTIKRSLNRLLDAKFIKIEMHRDKKTNSILYRKIFLTTPGFKTEPTPGFKTEPTRARNNILKNNTSINNYVNGSKNFNSKNQKTDVNIEWLNDYL